MVAPRTDELELLVRQSRPDSRPRAGKNARRHELVQCAMQALSFGRLALIPFAGLVFGPLAFYNYSKSRLLATAGWYPGRGQALVGGVLGFLGFAASVIWLVLALA